MSSEYSSSSGDEDDYADPNKALFSSEAYLSVINILLRILVPSSMSGKLAWNWRSNNI